MLDNFYNPVDGTIFDLRGLEVLDHTERISEYLDARLEHLTDNCPMHLLQPLYAQINHTGTLLHFLVIERGAALELQDRLPGVRLEPASLL